MADRVEKYVPTNPPFSINNSIVKEELEDDDFTDDKIFVSETAILTDKAELQDHEVYGKMKLHETLTSMDNIKTELSSSETQNNTRNDYVKTEEGIGPNHVKTEFDNRLIFCDHCEEHYEDYCTKCGMLAHILNGVALNNADDTANKEIPNDILEIRESPGHVGVFALRVIPESVKLGPFSGLSTSDCPRRLKRGKFVVPEDKLKSLNWMWHINPARNVFQRNLIPLQCAGRLYYSTNREVLAGEEMLVYFGEEYEESIDNDIEMNFIPPTAEGSVKDVFACTFCCLGFSSRRHLTRHKTTCRSNANGKFGTDELTQCPFCEIFFYEKEYLECHKPSCSCSRRVRECLPLAMDNQTVGVNTRKTRRLETYKCTRCKYKTTYKGDLASHLNKHYEVKMHRCEVCSRQFKTKGCLKLHGKSVHAGGAEGNCFTGGVTKANKKPGTSKVYGLIYRCPKCKFQTKYKYYLTRHVKTKHLKEFSYECATCVYKTNDKSNLDRHTKTKHLKEFSNACATCVYKTSSKSNLERHVKTKHLKEFSHACETCDYKTNDRSALKRHMRAQHLKELGYVCELCDYKTNLKSNLERHTRTKHLQEFSYECGMCHYKTNDKSNLDRHVKIRHLKQFTYKREVCDYETNETSNLKRHTKTKHLTEFSYECEMCDYKTDDKAGLKRHMKTQHLKELGYVCDICDYKTSNKSNLVRHINTKHLQEFSYHCETCDYKTTDKSNLDRHVKIRHLKQFNYKCELCDYETNETSNLERHVKTKHLKEFSCLCEICDYKTNNKRSLQVHVKTQHLKEFSHECEMCDYRTNYKSRLMKHIKTKHLKEFSYHCDMCDYKTNAKSSLGRHTKGQHKTR